MNLSENETKAISDLLKIASQKFSNHGCNDLPSEFFDKWTNEEKEKLMKEYWDDFTGEPHGYEEGYFAAPSDWCLMEFYANKLLQ